MKTPPFCLFSKDIQRKILSARIPITSQIDAFVGEYLSSNFKPGTHVLNYWGNTEQTHNLENLGYCTFLHDIDMALTASHHRYCLSCVYPVVFNLHTLAFIPHRTNILDLALTEMIDSVALDGTLIIGLDSKLNFRRTNYIKNRVSSEFIDFSDYSKKGWGFLLVASNRRS